MQSNSSLFKAMLLYRKPIIRLWQKRNEHNHSSLFHYIAPLVFVFLSVSCAVPSLESASQDKILAGSV